MNPAAIGAAIPARLLKKFMILPTVPTVPFVAINPGMLQPMGAANARPPRAMEIQMIATLALVVKAAPTTAIPKSRPMVKSVLRTLVGFLPLFIKASTNQPLDTKFIQQHAHGNLEQDIGPQVGGDDNAHHCLR